MAVKIGDVTIRIGASTKQLEADLRKADRALSASSKRFTDAGQKMTLAFTAPFAGLAAISVVKFDAQIQAIGQVEAALKSTGGVAGKTSEELQKSASALQELTTFGDEDILRGVTAQLLTFTNVAGEQFDKAQLAALNLSTRLGTDLTSQTLQLGKALNDPVKGITALGRAGIQFSKEQKETIKRFAETNQIAKAQDIILKELETQFGGSAEAAAKLGSGPIKQLNNQFGDLLEEFGKIISEAIIPFVAKLRNVVTAFQSMDGATKKTIVTVAALVATIGPLLFITGKLISIYAGIVGPIVKMIATLGAQAAASTAAAAANGVAATTTVAFGTALKATILVAAPYIAVIGAIAAGIYLLYKNYQSADKAASTLNDVQKESAKSMAAEKAQGDRLIKVINDETKSKQDKKKALDELIALSPEYFKGLTTEKDDIKKINTQYNDYITNLKKASFARAAKGQQDQIAINILNEENELRQLRAKQARQEVEAAQQSAKIQKGLSREGTNLAQNAVDATQREIDARILKIGVLSQESEALSEIINKNSQVVTPKKTGGDGGGPEVDLTPFQKSLKNINDELADLQVRFEAGLISPIEFTSQKTDVLKKKLELLAVNGFSPLSKDVAIVRDELNALNAETEAYFNVKPLESVVSAFQESQQQLLDNVGRAVNSQKAAKEIGTLEQRLKDAVTKNVPQPVVRPVLDTEEFEKNLEEIKQPFTNIFDFLGNKIASLPGIAEKLGENVQTLGPKIGKAFEGAVAAVQQVFSTFGAFFDMQEAKVDQFEEKEKERIANSIMGEEAKEAALANLNEKVLKKRKALARKQAALDKASALFSATIAGANAVLQALAVPLIGPVLAKITAGLVAAQLAFIAATPLPSLAIGTDMVRSDGLAMIHKGEAIVPADVAKGGYTGGGGIANVVGRIQGTDIILASDYSMNFKNRIR